MSEKSQFPPDDEDPVLDGYLHSLPRFAPRPGFEDRVLARVWRPAPMFLLVWRDRWRRAWTPRRIWTAAGAMAAGSTAWLVGLTSWLGSNVPSPSVARAWLASEIGAVPWDAIAAGAGPWITTAAQQAAQLEPFRGTALTVAAGTMLLPALSAMGLYLVMRRSARERARSYAGR